MTVSVHKLCMLAVVSLITNKVIAVTSTENVCIGDQLSLTCSTNGPSLQWSVTHPTITVIGIGNQPISNTTPESRGPFVTSLGVFTFYRTSTSPLTSVLVIDNTTATLNQTRVICDRQEGSSTTIITVLEIDAITNPTTVITKNEKFESENIKVNLTWSQENDVIDNLTISPHTPYLEAFVNQSVNVVELTLLYNTTYNVSIVGNSPTSALCRVPQSSISLLQLIYVKCGYPLDLPSGLVSNSTSVHGYTDPALAGTTVNISCPYGNVLSESDTTTIQCTENGEWEPEPSMIRCTVNCGAPSVFNSDDIIINYNSTLEGSLLELSCSEGLSPSGVFVSVCQHSGAWVPDPTTHRCRAVTVTESARQPSLLIPLMSSLIPVVCVASSVLLILLGFCCGRLSKKKEKSSSDSTPEDGSSPAQSPQQSMVYEDILPPRECDNDLEMKENVAYAPLKFITN